MSSKDLLLHTTPAMAHNLELESKRLIDVFELLGARDLPSTVLDATAGLWIDTRAFMISLLRRAICPEAVTEEILTKLEKEGWKRSLKHANDVALQFKNNENYQRVIVEFVREWVMQFILPLMDKKQRSSIPSDPEAETRLDLNVTTREMDRCAITGIYDLHAVNQSIGPFGKLSVVRIIPESIRFNDQAEHLIQVFTGGRITAIRPIVDKPENAILMVDAISHGFREFFWSLKQKSPNSHASTRSTLVVERFAPRQVHDIQDLPENSPVVLGDNDDSLSIAPPGLAVCQLHRAVTRLLHESGAHATILRYCRPWYTDREPPGSEKASSKATKDGTGHN